MFYLVSLLPLVIIEGADSSQHHWLMETMSMAKTLGTIHAKQVRGKMVIIGTGRTNTGVQFIKDMRPLNVSNMKDKKFKGAMKKAVDEMLNETVAKE